MPVYYLQCPDCDHRFEGMVMARTQPPREWACSKCGCRRAAPVPGVQPARHPWDGEPDQDGTGRAPRLRHSGSCPCCL